jgi:hypothetical protein
MRQLPTLLLALGLTACAQAPVLKPASSANRVTGESAAATTVSQGVRVTADGGAWKGDRKALGAVTPLEVTIQNDSGRPLRVRYREFVLITPDNLAITALSPLAKGTQGVGGSGEPSGIEARFESTGFLVAPALGGVYPGLGIWQGPFAFDPLETEIGGAIWPAELPTTDMVEQSIPQGVLMPEGKVTGFFFFREIPEGTRQVSFRAELYDAGTEQSFGNVEIPFDVPKD